MNEQYRTYPTLRALRNRALWRITLAAVCIAAFALVATSLLSARHNLQLVAHSLGYTLEAALVFGDEEAADEILQLLAAREKLGSVQVFDRNDGLFAEWHNNQGFAAGLLENLIPPARLHLPVMQGNRLVGSLTLTSNTRELANFLRNGFLLMFAGLGLVALGTLYLTNRIIHKISRPLQSMTQVAHKVRYKRDFEARVPQARIAELNELSEDLNELLRELEVWNRLQEREKAALNHQASHDGLTGLVNRNTFEARLAHTLLRARNEQSRFAVLYIDVDHFKQVNDSMGHDAGDQLLQALANRLRQQVRAGDTVARLGGDEFAILLPELSTREGAGRIADAIIRCMQEPVDLTDGTQFPMSLSIGISLYPDDAHNMIDLLKAADSAMYAAKKSGRSRWQHIPTSPTATRGKTP